VLPAHRAHGALGRPVEIGIAEKTAVGTAWTAAQFAYVELSHFESEVIKFRVMDMAVTPPTVAESRVVQVYRLPWLDRIALVSQIPMLVKILTSQFAQRD
jgi:hypothetical protein